MGEPLSQHQWVRQESRIGQREELNYNAVLPEASVNLTGRSGAGLVLQGCLTWGLREGCYTSVLTSY